MSESAVQKISHILKETEHGGVISGKVVKIDREGVVFVDFAGNRQGPLRAQLTTAAAEHISTRAEAESVHVLIAFEEDDILRPVIIDVICDRIAPPPNTVHRNELDEIRIDGESITFDAKKEIVLRCGKSSITLTRAGKVLIRGAYLLNRSSGVNRIKGGSVQIN